MNNWPKLLRTPLFFLIVHTVIIFFVVIFAGYLLALKAVTLQTNEIRGRIVTTNQTLDMFKTQGNYLQSDTFKIKYMKGSLDRKIKDEKIIDTNTWETNNNSVQNYNPNSFQSTQLESWNECLFGRNSACLTSN